MSEFARSFDRAAEEYERGRPGYAEAALDALGLPADSVVLDLAAGTGKLTRQLVPRFARLIAVEPLDGMRAQLERVVPGAEALVGTAESIPLDDDSVDVVFVAEAFHWFGTSAALDEIARVLRPGGTLAVLFNERDGELDPPLTQAFRDTLDELALKKPPEVTVSSGLWKAPFPGPFEPLEEERFPHTVERDREGLLASIASWSVVAGLPDDERAVLLGRLAELVPEGRYVSSLRTELYRTRLIG
jgi:ubiquinone/menaquinone biosynthesis C-methylase UbiE